MDEKSNFLNAAGVQQLLDILKENQRDKQATDFETLLSSINSFEETLNGILEEIQIVKSQLNDKPSKVDTEIVNRLESSIQKMQTQLTKLKNYVIETSQSIVEQFKEKGIVALDRMSEFVGIKSTLENLNKTLITDIKMVDSTIDKIKLMTQDFNAAVRHTANIVRVAAGNERINNPAKATKSLVKPFLARKKMLVSMKKSIEKALNTIDKLTEKARPSVLKALQEKPVKPVETITKAKEKDVAL